MPLFFQQTRFIITVAELMGLPNSTLSEIAFAGRSNAGKSSVINTLTNQKQLAFISKMPGRTQHLNFFEVIKHKLPAGYLVDLPGYGFAKASKTISHTWDNFLGSYLIKRDQLSGLVLVMDSRRPMTSLDIKMILWFAQTQKPIYIVLTKSDKLNNNQKQQAVTLCQQKVDALNLDKSIIIEIQLFSSLKKTGIENLSAKLQTWLR